jgi:hypothetical protein
MWRDEDLRAQARQRVTRSLSEAERARYLPTVTGPRPAPDSRSP